MIYIILYFLLMTSAAANEKTPPPAAINMVFKHPRFYSVQKELLKYFYVEKMWDQFFARLYFLKVRFPETQSEYDLVTLEALALSRLCYFKEALILLTQAKERIKEANQKVPPHLLKAENIMVSSLRLGGIDRAPKETYPGLSLITRDAFWQLQRHQIYKLDGPKHLRVNIKSRCY